MNVTISSPEGAAHLNLFDPAGGKDGTYVVSPWKGTVNKDTLSGTYGGAQRVGTCKLRNPGNTLIGTSPYNPI